MYGFRLARGASEIACDVELLAEGDGRRVAELELTVTGRRC